MSNVIPQHIVDLAKTVKHYIFYLELTTDCNMRCLYCTTSLPDFTAQTFPVAPQALVRAIKQTLDQNVLLQINGHGETTMLPWWTEIAEPLLDSGYKLCLLTNMKRKLSDYEISLLARFHTVVVSCDSQDEATHRKIRRGGNLANLISNVQRIRQHQSGVHLTLSSVCHNVFLDAGPSFLDWAVNMGFTSMVIGNLDVYEGLKNNVIEKPDMTDPANIEKLKAFDQKGRELGLAIEFQGLLKDVLD